MKNYLHRSVAIALALLLLNSTFSFAIAKHYCAGELVEVSYFGILEGCLGGDMQTEEIEAMTCCQDVEHLVAASNDEILPGVELDLHDFNFLQLFQYCNIQLFEYLTLPSQKIKLSITHPAPNTEFVPAHTRRH